MSTIITLIGAAALGLIGIAVVVLWRRTHRELHDLRRELRATQQELEIQRIVVDKPDDPPQRRRHLRALIFLAPLLLWIREHRMPVTAISASAAGTVVAVAILTQAGAPSEPLRPPRAAPAEPFTSSPDSSAGAPTSTSIAATSMTSSTSTPARPSDTGQSQDRTPAPPVDAPSPTSATTTAEPTSTTGAPPPSTDPPGGLTRLCVELDINPLIELDACLLDTPVGGTE